MKKLFFLLVLFFLIVGLLAAFCEEKSADISEPLIRLHIVANSDSPEDQMLKLKVRDAIREKMTHYTSLVHSKKELLSLLESRRSEILDLCRRTLSAYGSNDEVQMHIGKTAFPTKVYGNLALPAGTYDALNIHIGKGRGQNWWCVLFPPLCYTDLTGAITPYDAESLLKKELGEDNWQLLSIPTKSGNIPVKIEFKLLELFGKLSSSK